MLSEVAFSFQKLIETFSIAILAYNVKISGRSNNLNICTFERPKDLLNTSFVQFAYSLSLA